MTVQETIQALYEDIAAIKEFICEEKNENLYEYILISNGNYSGAVTVPIPDKSLFCTVNCTEVLKFSRVFDAENITFAQFTGFGFGSINQGRETDGSVKSLIKFEQIDSSVKLYALEKFSRFIHLNLDSRTQATVGFYKKQKIMMVQ